MPTDRLEEVVEGHRFASKSRELSTAVAGDRFVLLCSDGKQKGYWAVGTFRTSPESGTGSEHRVTVDIDHVRKSPLKPAAVTEILRKSRLRARFLPFDVISLSPPEYQVISRMVMKPET